MMKFVMKSVILLICVSSIQSDCNVCHPTNRVACHTENEYSICVNGKPTKDLIKCPKDFVCTLDSAICYHGDKAKPHCIPETRNNASTTDISTNAATENKTNKINSTNTSTATILSAESTTIATGTISQPTPTKSTPKTMKVTATFIPRDPTTICREAANTGMFYADDPTCTTIIVCFVVKGSWVGLKKSCGAGQYFGPNAKYCSNIKPDECT